MIYKIIPFLILGIVILFGTHLIVYHFIIHFFTITSHLFHNTLLIILIFLTFSFFIASLAAHWKDNLFTRAFYFLSASWLGFLTNLVLAIVLGWLTVYLIRAFGYKPDLLLIGILCVLSAFGFSVYGIYNAFNPRLKEISIKIKNLPEEWKDKTIVQISDIHLGHVYRAKFLQNIADKISALNPDLVVITGDLFDGMDGSLKSFIPPLKNITAKKGVFYVTGNHETYLGVEKALAIFKETSIEVLNDEMREIEGLQIFGISYPEREETKDLTKIVNAEKNYLPDKPGILLYHSPTNIMETRELGFDLQLAGHTHMGQLFPFNYITKAIYKGYDYGLHQLDDFLIYTTNGVGTWGPPVRTGNKPEIVIFTLQ